MTSKKGTCFSLSTLVVIISLLLIGLCYVKNVEAGVSNKPFKVAIVTWPGCAPPYLAIEKGLFGDLKVEVSVIDDAGPRRAAFRSGQMEALAETIDSYANGAASGLSGKVVIKNDDSFGGDAIVARKEITSLNDLRGKTVAYPEGMPSHFYLLYLLKEVGLTPSDIKGRPMDDPGKAGQAFISGNVDAAVTWEPFVTQAAETPHGHVLASTAQAQGIIADIIVVNENVIRDRPDDVQAFVSGWYEAVEYWKRNPKEGNEIMAKGLNLPVADFEAMISGLRLADHKNAKAFFGIEPRGPSRFEEMFDIASNAWKEIGLIDRTVAAKDVVDTKFIQNHRPSGSAPYPGEPIPVTTVDKKKDEEFATLATKLSSVHFVTARADLSEDAKQIIKEIERKWRYQYPTFVLRIGGHADERGADEANLELSRRRAKSVSDYLVTELNFPNNQIESEGYGEQKPLPRKAGESTDEWYGRCRRVEFTLIE